MCHLDHERAQHLADRYGISAVPVEDLLTQETIDLVLILTPPRTHAEPVHQAITARLRAVWVEKPFATDPQEATALTARAEHSGVLLGVAPDTVLGPALQTAAAALRDGLVGDLRSATAATGAPMRIWDRRGHATAGVSAPAQGPAQSLDRVRVQLGHPSA